ncbi:MAG TPA: ABC transporter permease [Oscillospiraceae bacterium]|nr:ABC transporter permease [Oscillospiraceae bacterium]
MNKEYQEHADLINVTANKRLSFRARLFSNKPATLAVVLIALFIISALLAAFIAPYPYDEQNLPGMMQAPSIKHLFGTDEFGRDIFSRVIYGTRISLIVGFTSVVISTSVGTLLGSLAGYYGGIVDQIITGLTDIVYSFPVSLLAIAVVAALGPSLFNLIIVISMVSWASYARLVRGQVLTLKEWDFVEAARALGMSNFRIIVRHILPNSLAPIIVMATLEIPKAIIIESTLSFLGLGVPPPTPSWGSIMNAGRSFILDAPWITMAPGVMMMVLVLTFNLFGDALRDTLDPRLND